MVPQTDFFGKAKNEMERRIEEYECAESALLIKTFNGIRQTLMARELLADTKQVVKPKVKTVGQPPVFLV